MFQFTDQLEAFDNNKQDESQDSFFLKQSQKYVSEKNQKNILGSCSVRI